MNIKTLTSNLKQKVVRLLHQVSEGYWKTWAKKWDQDLKLLEILAS